MAGIFMDEAIGAFIQWLFNGCTKSYKYYYDDVKYQSGIQRNFVIGFITAFTILFLVVYIISLISILFDSYSGNIGKKQLKALLTQINRHSYTGEINYKNCRRIFPLLIFKIYTL